MKEMLQVLISTIHKKSDNEINNLLSKMNVKTSYLMVNQIECTQNVNIKNKNVITVKQKGLSASRNLALENAVGSIVLLADDDIIYENNYEEIILDAYNKNPKADVLCFWVKSRNNKRKIKRLPNIRIGYIGLMRICSIQISMRIDKVSNIKFDENFGIGAKYNRGEEAIFLCDCLRNHLKIKFINKKIAEVEQKESSWYTGFSKEYFRTQGKTFRRMYPKFYKLIILQFAIRKYFLYRKNVKFRDAIKEMLA